MSSVGQCNPLAAALTDTENGIIMSKTVKTERNTDTARFIDLLTKAQGDRTRTQFAKDCGISLPHLSKFFNNRIEKPPIPSTLKKLADHAANGVTYEELLDAVGYNVEAYAKEPARKLLSPNLKLSPAEFKKVGLGIITTALTRSHYSWSMRGGNAAENYWDIFVDIAGNPIIRWGFLFLSELPPENPNRSKLDQLGPYYAQLLHIQSGIKLVHSFVTESPALFDLMIKNPPFALAMHVSVMLVDTTTLSIVKTVQLKTAFPDDPNLPQLT